MDTQSTAAEGRFELEEKYRRWKETHLPDGNLSNVWPVIDQLQTLSDERLKAAHEAAVAGLIAEKLLAHVKPTGFSNPTLVSMRRSFFRELAKAKLLNSPNAPAIEAYLKHIDEELARRKITIQDPELN